jgi:NADH-quinone oxidoreductase subunit G
LVNNEGRAQRYYQVYRPEASVRASWGWIEEIRARLAGGAGGNGSDAFRTGGGDPLRVSWEELVRDLAAEFDVFAPLAADPPSGKGVPGPECSVPRQPKRYSGRTAMHAAEDVHEPRTLPDRDTLLSFSMEGADLMPPPELIPRYWRPGWNSCQAVNAYQSKIAGALRGGNPGQRILRVGSAGGWQYFAEASSAFERRDGEWLVVPAYHVFGSEELSAFAPAIAELIPESYVALNAADAERLDAREGERVSVRVQDQVFEAPLVVRASLPDGVAVLPVGLPGLPGLSLPEWAVLSVPQRGGDSVPADGSEGET